MKPISIKRLINAVKIQFFTSILNVMLRFDLTTLQLQEVYDLIFGKLEVIKEGYKPDLGSEYTAQVQAADNRRDVAYKLLYGLSKVFSKHFDPVKAEAAQQIADILQKYGSQIDKMQYAEESSSLEGIENDLSEEPYTGYLTALSATDLLTELKEGNAAFKTLYVDRAIDNSQDQAIATGELLKDLINDYALLKARFK